MTLEEQGRPCHYSVLIIGRQREIHTDTKEAHAGGRGSVDSEVGAMQLRDKDCPQPPEAERQRTDSPRSLRRESGPADTLSSDFWPPQL